MSNPAFCVIGAENGGLAMVGRLFSGAALVEDCGSFLYRFRGIAFPGTAAPQCGICSDKRRKGDRFIY
ncbi:MAG: hypothetical protein NTV33_06670 [Coprothermobacterota bacterium]|nr:hypothetical protein [Coprothermobacterota bacterium]